MKTTKLVITSALVIALSSLTACGGGGSSGGGSGNNQPKPPLPQQAAVVSIDNTGVVPVFGNSSTTTVVYVHNNSDTPVSEINYSAIASNILAANAVVKAKGVKNNLENSKSQILDPQSASACASIAPHGSCPLTFTTPALSEGSDEGSLVITAHYSQLNKALNFSQIINYAQARDENQAGFLSGVLIANFGNKVGYGTVYLYGGGNGKSYQVENLTVDRKGVDIISGNIKGQAIASHSVQAVELTAVPAPIGISANMHTTSKLLGGVGDSNSQYSTLGVVASSQQAVLTASNVSLINAVTNATGNVLTISNIGNQNAILKSFTAEPGISIDTAASSCKVNASLAFDTSNTCTIIFGVNKDGGSGKITVSFDDGTGSTSTLDQVVSWYNPTSGGMAGAVFSNSGMVVYDATLGESALTVNLMHRNFNVKTATL